MAVGLLLGEKHSFMHDLESFFWVLFWICIHYDGPNVKARVVERFEKWNYADTEELAELKSGLVSNERHFLNRITQYFTPFYHGLNRLRRQIFPGDRPWEREDRGLYVRVKRVLQEAQNDPKVQISEK